MPFLLPRSLVCTAPPTQGHVEAARFIGGIYIWGQGASVDYARALAAYKIGAEGGNAICQNQLGNMLSMESYGVDPLDYKQALVWYGKAAAQDDSYACIGLGSMAYEGLGQTASWRRAREHFQRAIDLGNTEAAGNMQVLREEIQKVTGPGATNHPGLRSSSPPAPAPARPPHGRAG